VRAVTYTINHNVKDIASTIELILEYISIGNSIQDDMIFEVRVVLNELIVNAICHGNNCDQNKTAYVTFKMINGYLYVSVRDEGVGFNHKISMDECINNVNNEFCEHGRGLVIVRQLCSRVKFNKCGNKVSIIKPFNRSCKL
jgi:serine/threonine-protein kinase RsbW